MADTAAEVVANDPFRRLAKAKDAVRWLLDHPEGLVDMHGLVYWAKCVHDIRDEIKRSL